MITAALDLVAAYTAPGWVWTATTVIGAVIALALIGVLTAHVLLAAVSRTGPNNRDVRIAAIQRPLVVAAVPLLVLLLIVILARFGLILAERPDR